MPTSGDFVRLRDAAQIIDTLNEVAEIDGVPERFEFLLRRQQRLLNRDGRCALALLDTLGRDPAPRVLKRFLLRPDWEPDLLDDAPVQEIYDSAFPISQKLIPRVLANIRTPVTMVLSSDLEDPSWFRGVMLPRYLAPTGYNDVIFSLWAASADRAVCITHMCGVTEPPFGESDRTLVSLMLRAVAPLIDRKMFRLRDMFGVRELGRSQQDVLLLLLAGDSEKEIATALDIGLGNVHGIVGQLCAHFDVANRGELIALFIDRAVSHTMN